MLSQDFVNCIHFVINENFSNGEYFDTHTVINEIFRNKDYLKHYLTNFNSATEINQYHAMISQVIGDSGLVEPVKDSNGNHIKVKTDTVFDKSSPNQLWKRI